MRGNDDSGSPDTGGPEYLIVGLLRRPHGVRGELLLEVYTDFPERLRRGATVLAGEAHEPLVIAGRRPHAEGLLIAFQGIHTPEEAGRYRNCYLYVRARDLPPLPVGEYYVHQIIGLDVVAEDGRRLGRLSSVLETGANKVYVVSADGGRELLLPAIPQVIRAVDLQARTIHVHLLPGLLEED